MWSLNGRWSLQLLVKKKDSDGDDDVEEQGRREEISPRQEDFHPKKNRRAIITKSRKSQNTKDNADEDSRG